MNIKDIKVGDILKTRNGSKVEITKVDLNSPCPLEGVIYDERGNKLKTAGWNMDGSKCGCLQRSIFDLKL